MFSDTHFGYANYTNKHAQSVTEILAMSVKPAAVFINGDVTDMGLDWEIELFKSTLRDPLVAAGIPVYAVVGNHDGNNLGTVTNFCEKMGIPAYQSIDIQDTHFIITKGVPDNTQLGHGGSNWDIGDGGQIDADQLVWLENDLKSQANTDAKLTIMMNHFPLYGQVQNGGTDGYVIQNTDWFGNVTNANTKLKQWVDQYGVDVYLYGHRHKDKGANLRDAETGALLASIPGTQGLAMQIFTPESTGNDNLFMQMLVDHSGSGSEYSYLNAQGITKLGAAGYDVFDVDGYTISHYRKIIDTYYGQQIGPQQQWTMTVVPEPATMGLLALGGLAMIRRRRTA